MYELLIKKTKLRVILGMWATSLLCTKTTKKHTQGAIGLQQLSAQYEVLFRKRTKQQNQFLGHYHIKKSRWFVLRNL